MGALDLRGFVSEPTSFEGLDRLSNNLYNQRQQKIKDAKELEGRQIASTKYVTDYLSEKDKYTGTNFDPIKHELINDATNTAYELIKKGVDLPDVMTAISQKVGKADKYTMLAQRYAADKKNYTANLKTGGAKGIDWEKLDKAIDKQAFPEGWDIDKFDPNINYGDLALQNEDVFNTEGFDEDFRKAPKNTEKGTMKFTNKDKKSVTQKVNLISPYYAMSEKDADGNHIGFVPKYQTATDEGNELIHEFETEHGKVKAPIRLFDKELFDALPPNQMAYLRKEAEKYATQKGVHLSSKQAENLARAIAYDEKKARINGTFEHYDDKKEAPIKIYTAKEPTQGAKKAAQNEKDITESLDAEPLQPNGKINVSKYINGITYLVNSKGKRISQPEIYFDPKDKTFTYIDDEGKTQTNSFAQFKSQATTNGNPGSDMSFLEGFRNYNRTEKEAPKQENGGFMNKAKKFAYRFIGGQAPEKKTETKPKATTPPVMKNKSDYYNIETNVDKMEGNQIHYKDGTVWEFKNNKLVQIK